MPFTVTELHDLIRLLEEHPDWRTELRRILFSQDLLDLPRTVQELAIAQRRTEEALTRLTERLEQGFAEAAADRQHIWERLEQGFAEAAADRQHIWERLEQGFAEAATDRQHIWERLEQGFTEAATDRQHIWERLEQGFTEAAQGFAEAAADRQHIWERLEQGFAEAAAERREMRQDIGRLKGMGQEQFYRDRAASIFGRLLAQGHNATAQVADHLQEARRTGAISDQEYQEVLAADLLWGGQVRDSRQAIVLVLEASWTVGRSDVERAARRGAVLRRVGLQALSVAAGQEWPSDVQAEARGANVVMVQDGVVDQSSWETALADV